MSVPTEMLALVPALPCDAEGPVFREPWEAQAFALAIVGAEYVLGWLPRGTHTWSKFVKPPELDRALAAGGLSRIEFQGVSFDPLADRWRLTGDLGVNYMALATRPA